MPSRRDAVLADVQVATADMIDIIAKYRPYGE
jgi:hypothetical protein